MRRVDWQWRQLPVLRRQPHRAIPDQRQHLHGPGVVLSHGPYLSAGRQSLEPIRLLSRSRHQRCCHCEHQLGQPDLDASRLRWLNAHKLLHDHTGGRRTGQHTDHGQGARHGSQYRQPARRLELHLPGGGEKRQGSWAGRHIQRRHHQLAEHGPGRLRHLPLYTKRSGQRSGLRALRIRQPQQRAGALELDAGGAALGIQFAEHHRQPHRLWLAERNAQQPDRSEPDRRAQLQPRRGAPSDLFRLAGRILRHSKWSIRYAAGL